MFPVVALKVFHVVVQDGHLSDEVDDLAATQHVQVGPAVVAAVAITVIMHRVRKSVRFRR